MNGLGKEEKDGIVRIATKATLTKEETDRSVQIKAELERSKAEQYL
jgi:hypothetical protein